jgi:hypothetical protein
MAPQGKNMFIIITEVKCEKRRKRRQEWVKKIMVKGGGVGVDLI